MADDVTWFMSWVTFCVCVCVLPNNLPNNTWIVAHLLWALIRLKQVSTILKLPAALPQTVLIGVFGKKHRVNFHLNLKKIH